MIPFTYEFKLLATKSLADEYTYPEYMFKEEFLWLLPA